MPVVNGKHFPYTKEGQRAAKQARKKGNKSYSSDVVKMARRLK